MGRVMAPQLAKTPIASSQYQRRLSRQCSQARMIARPSRSMGAWDISIIVIVRNQVQESTRSTESQPAAGSINLEMVQKRSAIAAPPAIAGKSHVGRFSQ